MKCYTLQLSIITYYNIITIYIAWTMDSCSDLVLEKYDRLRFL